HHFMNQLRYLSLVSEKQFRGDMPAMHRTRRTGSGIEFAGHRDYVPGDDLRYLDWNVYARLGRRQLRLFDEEEDLYVYILMDCSLSMSVGKPIKSDYAKKVAAALACIALSGMDRVSIMTFSDRIHDVFPPARGQNHLPAVLRFLCQCQCRNSVTDLTGSVRDFLRKQPRPGLVILISDFFDPDGFESGLDLLRYERSEPEVVQIFDRTEQRPEFSGDCQITDIETNVTTHIVADESALAGYRLRFERFLDAMRKYCVRHGCGCTISSTEVPPEELVLQRMRKTGRVR
ncbi:MAG: DUF58 domain-containing protein, partial [Planctomycetia bacterium]|nr:DUF58 domain-containing protein [Planctomycetia bacterium]